MNVRPLTVLIAAGAVLLGPITAPRAAESPSAESEPVFEEVFIRSHDGVRLHGWIARPPEATVPTILHSSPYFGWIHRGDPIGEDTPSDASWWSDPPYPSASLYGVGVPPIRFVRDGYAVAFFEVRGTGHSGGCWEWMGRDEQRDQAVIVNWIAEQSWSDGNVGMGGLSYMSGTSWEAALQAPPALKTIVVAGTVSDMYTLFHTPQGAHVSRFSSQLCTEFCAGFTGAQRHALVPPGADPGAAGPWIERLTQRACDDVLNNGFTGLATTLYADSTLDLRDERNATFWKERRLIDGYPNVGASVMLVHGAKDLGHAWQDELTASSIRAPFRQIQGQWGHRWPFNPYADLLPVEWEPEPDPRCPDWEPGDLDRLQGWGPRRDIWCQTVFEWFDYWLKGIGDRPQLRVEYQDDRSVGKGMSTFAVPGETSIDEWHYSQTWPPRSKERVLYLRGSALAATPGGGSRTFVSTTGTGENAPWASLGCSPEIQQAWRQAAAYVTEPFAKAVDLAGDPFVYARLSRDGPPIPDEVGGGGGIVSFNVVELDPDRLQCGNPLTVDILAAGSADLRYHGGGYAARPFPDGPTPVRVDLFGLASRIEAGHRLALVATHGEVAPFGFQDRSGASLITLHAGDVEASQLVLPVTKGQLGSPPHVAYPPRPWGPGTV
jgi:putative CocE/NonD family hydrolase